MHAGQLVEDFFPATRIFTPELEEYYDQQSHIGWAVFQNYTPPAIVHFYRYGTFLLISGMRTPGEKSHCDLHCRCDYQQF
jgi:hypothetical protein